MGISLVSVAEKLKGVILHAGEKIDVGSGDVFAEAEMVETSLVAKDVTIAITRDCVDFDIVADNMAVWRISIPPLLAYTQIKIGDYQRNSVLECSQYLFENKWHKAESFERMMQDILGMVPENRLCEVMINGNIPLKINRISYNSVAISPAFDVFGKEVTLGNKAGGWFMATRTEGLLIMGRYLDK